jgi:hypothetical protein
VPFFLQWSREVWSDLLKAIRSCPLIPNGQAYS